MQRVSELINLKYAHNRGIMGRGIGVAIVDTGISNHPDFSENGKSRIVGFSDLINKRDIYYDDNGHGTHVDDWTHKRVYLGCRVSIPHLKILA